ncbi:hypothetical protein JHD50_09180 [Sulfurimonas sp. MAG313]|nr:hypothetical protein [Sulfurimonas sp. MAG313]MDF1881470.1 hypothetical protein [Sulfurimonas sp. MAG313]
MRKYNFIILFILILITISISTYFFYLDIIYRDKLVKKDVEALYSLKRAAGKPIVQYSSAQELELKKDEYNEIILELNLDAVATHDKSNIVLSGVIHNSYSYILLKKLLHIVKNDNVNLILVCIGKECTNDIYGFLIKIKPYSLKL